MCGKDLLIRLVGFEFWKRLCAEHGIGHDGILTDYAEEGLDRKDVFFYRVGERLNDITERLITAILSRAVLFDLEPRVIDNIKESEYKDFFNPENMFR